MGRRGRDRYLLDAINYGRELTPAGDCQRLARERMGEIKTAGAGSSLPGEAPNVGASAEASPEQRPRVVVSR